MKENWNKILNVVIILTLIAFVCIIIIKKINFDDGLNKYQTGLEFYKAEDFQNAYYNFSRVPKTSKYYYISLFRQGMCAEKLNDNKIQAQKYAEFAKKSENILTTEALFKAGKAFYNEKDLSSAKKVFKKASKNFTAEEQNDYALASNYYMGEIEKDKNPKGALKYYFIYLENVDDGKYSNESLNSVIEILSKDEAYELTENENYALAKALFYVKKYKDSQNYAESLSDEKTWFLKYQNYIKLGDKTNALNTLRVGLTNYSKTVSKEELSKAINDFVTLYSTDKNASWKTLENLVKDIDFPAKDEIYYNLGEYQQIVDKKLLGDYAPKALYNLFFNAYNNKQYNLARVYGTIQIEKFPNSLYTPKVLYYLGKTYGNLLKSLESQQMYNRLMVNYPDSFWAFRAYIKTHHNKSKFANMETLQYQKINVQPKIPQFPYNEVNISNSDANLLNDLIKLNDYDLIEKFDSDNLALRSWTNYKSGNISLSVVLARDYLNSLDTKPDFQDDLYILAYPILYKDAINKNIEINNLNGYLIESLIREESYFNEKAKSSVGALGLMQLMPSTANFITKTSVSKDQLLSPEYNIALGTKYFNYIKRTLNNNNVYAVLAYNGGPGAVQSWINKNPQSEIDEFIENIPYDETQNYIFKVYRTYWNYLNIYAQDKL